MPTPLPRSFFDRNAAQVAPELIGCLLVRRDGARVRLARIVETEAYVGEHDLACHAKAGRTARTDPMYGEPGRAYVYFVYGIHYCLNAVCGPGGAPNAVLLRAAAPLADSELTAVWPAEQPGRNGTRTARIDGAGIGGAGPGAPDRGAPVLAPLLHSASGPGNLCRALAVDRALNRADLCDGQGPLFVAPRIVGVPNIGIPRIWRGPRIGVDYAGEWATKRLRFCDRDDPRVSKPRPPPARATRRRGR